MTIQGRMKTILGLAVAAGVVSIAGVAHLRAQQMAPFQALATIPSTCTLSASDINFGVYDPIIVNKTTPKDAEGTITLSCTGGLTPVLTLLNWNFTPDGHIALFNGTDWLSWSLYKDAARTQRVLLGEEIARPTDFLINGGTITIPVYARIEAGQTQARSGTAYQVTPSVRVVY